MAAEKLYLLWGLLPLVVAVAAFEPGRPWKRAAPVFALSSVPFTFLLLGFAPRPAFGLAVAVAATFAVGAAIIAAWRLLVPESRGRRLAIAAAAVAAAVVAGLATIYAAEAWQLDSVAFKAMLLASAAAPVAIARWRPGRLP